MNETGADRYATELRAFERRKRRVYSVAALVGVVVLALSWVTREADDTLMEIAYPVLAAVILGFVVAMHRDWGRLVVLERLVLGAIAVVVLGRLAWHLHLAGPIDDHLLVLTGAHYWSVATLVVAGFVLLDRARGLWFGLAVLLVSIVLVATGAGSELVGPDGSQEALLYLVRLHGFLVLLLVLVASVASLREQLYRALARAETLEELATTDPLTGLANRRAASRMLDREVRAARRDGREVSVVVLDLDHFKAVNDVHGHATGDHVLRDVGRILRDEARDVDLPVRWGGEEFLVIAPGTPRLDALRMAERLRRAIAEGRPGGLGVTATCGVAEHVAGELPEDLLQRADQLLFEAKRNGRDRVLADGPASADTA